ncbi:MAG: helix-turn-helix domain-containing protein [Aggregatilineales bacterium]
MKRLLSIAQSDEPHWASVLGTTVREWRQNRGLTRRDFARALDVSISWLTAFENGCVTADELDTALINDMAQILGIEPIALELLAELDEDKLWEEVDRLRESEQQRQKRECSYHP